MKAINYFSKKEEKSMNKFKKLRDKAFSPILKILMKLGLTANIISYIGLFVLIGFVLYAVSNPLIALIFLILHLVMDSIDGPLARLMKQSGSSGTFTDALCDHTAMAVVIITLIYSRLINPVLGSSYIFLYLILVFLIIMRNNMNLPIKFVIRTTYFVYLLYAIWALAGLNYMNIGLIASNIVMIPPILSSYFIIKRKLK